MDIINQFSDEAKSALSDFEMNDAPGATLFHYRKLEHAEDILRTQNLRYSDFKLLDDEREVKLGHEEINKLINLRQKISRHKVFWGFMNRTFGDMLKNQSIYTLSLCHKGEDEKLWNEYGQVSLGFNFKIADTAEVKKFSDAKHLLKVIYFKDVSEFRRRINILLDLADQRLPEIPRQLEEEYGRELAATLIVNLFILMPMLKGDEFSWENEYRIVIPGLINLVTRKRSPFEIPKESFRDTAKHKNHHVVCLFDCDELTEIRFGPKVENHQQEKIKSLITTCGFHVTFDKGI